VSNGSTLFHRRQGHVPPTPAYRAGRVVFTSAATSYHRGAGENHGRIVQCGGRRLRLTDTTCQRLVALINPLGRTRLRDVAIIATEETNRAPKVADTCGKAKISDGLTVFIRRSSFPFFPYLVIQGICRRGGLHDSPH